MEFDLTNEEGRNNAKKLVADIINNDDKESMIKITYFLLNTVSQHEIIIRDLMDEIVSLKNIDV